MAKDPRFNFYTDNWLGGTEGFTLEEEGAYLSLIILQSKVGRFTKEQALDKLLQKTRGNTAVSTKLWNFLIPKFSTDGNLFWSVRLEKEMSKSKKHSLQQTDRINKRWQSQSGNTAVLPVNGSGIDCININKELCKIFGKEYLTSKERMPAEANWYNTIEGQAKEILTVLKPDEAVKQIQAYIRYCHTKERQLIGKNYKAAETILSSNWLELLGENKSRAPDKFETPAYNKTLWTLEEWERRYDKQLKTNPEFRKHFGYGKLLSSDTVGK